MKYPRNKKNNRGVSIIEIVVAMILLMTVMMSLAFVYPNGRRLTESSDYRTRATEIAKSIIEEIKLIPFETASPLVGRARVSNICLLSNNNNFISLNALDGNGALTSGRMTQARWPYHHLADWDATEADGDNPVCPFFIVDTDSAEDLGRLFIDHRNRKFSLVVNNLDPTNLEEGQLKRSIWVTPTNIPVGNLAYPSMAIINVTVYWGVHNGDHNTVDSVTLTDSRTRNIY